MLKRGNKANSGYRGKKGRSRPILWLVAIVSLILYASFFSSYGRITGFFLSQNAIADDEVLREMNAGNEARVIVMLEGSLSIEDKEDVFSTLEADDFELRSRYSTINAFSGNITRRGFEKLMKNPDVIRIYPDRRFNLTVNDTALMINATSAWQKQMNGINITGKGETVCVIDSGINYSHPALGGGWGNKVIGGYDFANNDSDPMDDNGHGTHVAGIIASNDPVYRGISPDASLIAIRACNAGTCYESDFTAGIDWCVGNSASLNISVITISIGGGAYSNSSQCDPYPAAQSISAARGKRIIVTVASGNNLYSNAISYPACSSNATSVGSVGKDGSIASYSNTASILDILAPGGTFSSKIISTGLAGGFAGMSGTSMAAPHAAGAAALIHQYERLLNGLNATAEEIENLLKKGGKMTAHQNGLFFPRIDIMASLNSVLKLNSSENSISDQGGSKAKVRFFTSTDLKDASEAFSISDNFVSLDSAAYPGFNKAANITFYSLSFAKAPVILKDGNVCISPSCEIISYLSGNLSFKVAGFSNYTSAANSQLYSWNSADSGMPFYSGNARVNASIFFYANYTNRTSESSISSGQCNITFSDYSAFMAFNATKNAFEYNRTFSFTGFKDYSILCNHTDFESLNISDSAEVLTSNVNCTYPGANINWTISNQAVVCINENLLLNHSSLNLINSTFILEGSNLTLAVGDAQNMINVSEDSIFTAKNSRIESQTASYFNTYIYGSGNLNDSIFNKSKIYISGNKTNYLKNSIFYDYIYLMKNSTNHIENSTVRNYTYFGSSQADSPISIIEDSSFYDRVYVRYGSNNTVRNSWFNTIYLRDASTTRFLEPASNITASLLSYEAPKIYGHVRMPPSGQIVTGNLTRSYPVRVVYSVSTSKGVSGKHVNITDKAGNLIWESVTDSDGWAEANLTLNSTNYGSGNFTISSNSSSDIFLLTDAPLTLQSSDSILPIISELNATPNPVQQGSLISLTANATDNVQIGRVWIWISGESANHTMDYVGNFYAYNGFDTTDKSGPYNYTVYANDTSGNNALPKTSNFTVLDITSPTISIISPLNGTTLSAGTTASWMNISTDETAVCRYNMTNSTFDFSNGINFTNTNSMNHSFYYSGLSAGSYSLYYKCNDSYGNINGISAAHTFSISSSSSGGTGDGGSGGGGGGGGGGGNAETGKENKSIQVSGNASHENLSAPIKPEEKASPAPSSDQISQSSRLWIWIALAVLMLFLFFIFLAARKKRDYEALLKKLIGKAEDAIVAHNIRKARKICRKIDEIFKKIPSDRRELYHEKIARLRHLAFNL